MRERISQTLNSPMQPQPRGHTRCASVADLNALLALESSFPTDRLSPRSFRYLLLKGHADVLVYEEDQQLCGNVIVLYRKHSPAGRLYSLVVHPDHQRKGIAKHLLRSAETHAQQRGCKVTRLEVRADNQAAIGLYLANQYVVTGHKEGYYEDGSAAVCMQKIL